MLSKIDVVETLQQSGWSSNREVDEMQYSAFLKERDIVCFDKAAKFYSMFGGLKISYITLNGNIDVLDFAVLHYPAIEKDIIESDIRLLNRELSFLGVYYDNRLTITMDDGGVIYSSSEEKLFLFGSDPLEAIERIMIQKPLQTILRIKQSY